MAKIRLTVELKIPKLATHQEVRAYVEDAVKSWCGSLEPVGRSRGDSPETYTTGDPMFDLDQDSVQVRIQTKRS